MQTRSFHQAVFTEVGLSLDNWTLYLPMKLIAEQYGSAAVEARWERIRETGGDGLDGLTAAIALSQTMGMLASTNPDPQVREQAQKWLAINPGLANFEQMGASFELMTAAIAQSMETNFHEIVDAVWTKSIYLNGVTIEKATGWSPDHKVEPGGVRVGDQTIGFSLKYTYQTSDGHRAVRYVGNAGTVYELDGVVTNFVANQTTSVGALQTTVMDGAGRLVSTVTIDVFDDGSRLETTTSGSTTTLTAFDMDGKRVDLTRMDNLLAQEIRVDDMWSAGRLSNAAWLGFTDWSAHQLAGSSGTQPLGSGFYGIDFGFDAMPIGAFYDSQSANAVDTSGIDTAPVEAPKTAEPARMEAGTKRPDMANVSGVPADRAPHLAPASNFTALRATDPYFVSVIGTVFWTANQIKVNQSSPTYLIGTAGNDVFDASYYSRETIFDSSLFVNFVAGDGDDLMGGSRRNDQLWGGAGIDLLLGYEGSDSLYGEEGDDELHGQDGHDYLDGGAGQDLLFGGVGNDVLVGNAGDDVLVGFTPSNDAKQTLLPGETDDDHMFGGDGDDEAYGGIGNDYLDGGAGRDLLFGEDGGDVLLGQQGNDQLSGGADNDALDGGEGDDLLFGGTGKDLLMGGAGNDELQGQSDDDDLSGESGNDKLFGQAGNDVLRGGDGDDVLMGFTASNDAQQTLFAGEMDNDRLWGEAGDDYLNGGLGDDLLDGGDGRDQLMGGAGDDTLHGGSGTDELQGNDGHDQLVGGDGDDRLFGQVGNDRLWGSAGNDVLIGFTAANEWQQWLLAGQTDDDEIDGGDGNDLIIGAFGRDVLFGGSGQDELQGGDGADRLFGEEGDDNLFGQEGDDVLSGGAGDDVLVGFTASNEARQSIAFGESDNDTLYGGSGRDVLIGGLGDDYLDGGTGADQMLGGQGNDTYVVSSVNDTIYEAPGEGHDTVLSSVNYLLAAGVENLRLIEGYSVHGTGNSLDNHLVGNSSDNILDGVEGADVMAGAGGNDTYYVDDARDVVQEAAGEGVDTIQTSVDYTLSANVENLTLLDFSKPERGLVDGRDVLVYGYPKRNELDYMQGDAVPGFLGTCALTSIANLLTQSGQRTSESNVVNLAINNQWTLAEPGMSIYQLGGTNVLQQRAILDDYGVRNDVIAGYAETGLANLVSSGRGVIVAVNAGALWSDSAYENDGQVNHAVTLTGAVRDADTGALAGFYIADSGRGLVSDMTRFVDIETFRAAADVPHAYAIYSIEPIKLWEEDFAGTGNEMANSLIGNRGDNLLMGLGGGDTLRGEGGDDTLDGGAGDDRLSGGAGDDIYVLTRGGGNDLIVRQDVAAPEDTIQFGADVQADQIWFSRVGSDLRIGILGASDSITVEGWYDAAAPSVAKIKSGDRRVLDGDDVAELVTTMAALQPLPGMTTISPAYSALLDNVMANSWHPG